jgi:hypothetical protein
MVFSFVAVGDVTTFAAQPSPVWEGERACLLRITGFPEPNQPDLPDGQSILIFGIDVKPRNRKYFCFTESKSRLHLIPSRPDQRGVS